MLICIGILIGIFILWRRHYLSGRAFIILAHDLQRLLMQYREVSGGQRQPYKTSFAVFLSEQIVFTSAKPISDTLEFSRLVADIRFDFRQSDSVTQIWWGRLAVSCAFVLLIRVVCLPATGALWFVDFTDAVAAGIGLLNLFFLVGLQRKIVPKHWLFSKGRVTRSGKMWLLGIFTERLQHEDVEIKEWRLQGLPCAAATTQHLLTLARELQAQYRLKVQQRADLMPLFDILASGLLAMCWLATVFAQFTSAVGF